MAESSEGEDLGDDHSSSEEVNLDNIPEQPRQVPKKPRIRPILFSNIFRKPAPVPTAALPVRAKRPRSKSLATSTSQPKMPPPSASLKSPGPKANVLKVKVPLRNSYDVLVNEVFKLGKNFAQLLLPVTSLDASSCCPELATRELSQHHLDRLIKSYSGFSSGLLLRNCFKISVTRRPDAKRSLANLLGYIERLRQIPDQPEMIRKLLKLRQDGEIWLLTIAGDHSRECISRFIRAGNPLYPKGTVVKCEVFF